MVFQQCSIHSAVASMSISGDKVVILNRRIKLSSLFCTDVTVKHVNLHKHRSDGIYASDTTEQYGPHRTSAPDR